MPTQNIALHPHSTLYSTSESICKHASIPWCFMWSLGPTSTTMVLHLCWTKVAVLFIVILSS